MLLIKSISFHSLISKERDSLLSCLGESRHLIKISGYKQKSICTYLVLNSTKIAVRSRLNSY